MSTKRIGLIISILIVSINSSLFADWKENADAIKISGGEDYTLVLTKNKWLWAFCQRAFGVDSRIFT